MNNRPWVIMMKGGWEWWFIYKAFDAWRQQFGGSTNEKRTVNEKHKPEVIGEQYLVCTHRN